jgi:P-type Mg2+ transporter
MAQARKTAWFVVSLLTEIAVVFSLRTRVLAIRSMPGKMLIAASLVVSVVALAVPYLGAVTQRFGFVPLPLPVVVALLAIVLVYLGSTELTKHWLYKFR